MKDCRIHCIKSEFLWMIFNDSECFVGPITILVLSTIPPAATNNKECMKSVGHMLKRFLEIVLWNVEKLKKCRQTTMLSGGVTCSQRSCFGHKFVRNYIQRSFYRCNSESFSEIELTVLALNCLPKAFNHRFWLKTFLLYEVKYVDYHRSVCSSRKLLCCCCDVRDIKRRSY